MKKSLILIKIGGSSITDKTIPYKIREDVIRKIAKDLKKISLDKQIIISHGAGSFAHTSASIYGGKKGYKSRIGIAKVSRDAAKLNQLLIDVFVEENLPAIYMRPMSMILSKGGKLTKHFFEILEQMVNQGLIPVVYGDVIWDTEWKSTIFSGEKILSEIAIYLMKKGYKIEKVIQVGETKGVYDLKGRTIKEIKPSDMAKIGQIFAKNGKIDVTGGMKHKVENAILLAQKGIKTFIIDGLTPNELTKAVKGKSFRGTTINV